MKKKKIEKKTRAVEELMITPNRGMERNPNIGLARDHMSKKVINCFDVYTEGAYRLNQEDDDIMREELEPVEGLIKYGKEIEIDYNDDGVPAPKALQTAMIFESDSAFPTAVYPESKSLSLACNPVIVGTKEQPLGLFVPFSASPKSLVWTSSIMAQAAFNFYQRRVQEDEEGFSIERF